MNGSCENRHCDTFKDKIDTNVYNPSYNAATNVEQNIQQVLISKKCMVQQKDYVKLTLMINFNAHVLQFMSKYDTVKRVLNMW